MSQTPQLILNGRIFAYGDGGIERYARRLLRALDRHPNPPEWRIAISADLTEKIAFVPPARRLILPAPRVRGYVGSDVVWNQRLSNWVRRHCPDAILHHMFHCWMPFPARRTMITAYDCLERRFPVMVPNKRVQLYQRLAWRSARRAEAVVAISHWTRDEVIRWWKISPARVTTIPCWLDQKWEKPPSTADVERVRQHYGLPANYVFYVGGFRPHKNVETLLQAWAQARSGEPLPPLVLGGKIPQNRDDPTRVPIDDAVNATGLTSRELICPGAIPDQDLPAFYAGAALFVSPSLHEGFGYPAVEAMACGTPLVVADSTALRETVTNPSMRFDPKDPGALLNRVRAALAQPDAFRLPVDPCNTEAQGIARYLSLVREVLRK